jgi:uncharacterized protein YbjT (DUF2867 family)
MAGSIDGAMFGYFGAKLSAERIVAESGLPWTTLRATQFHELTFTTVRQMAKLPVIPVPSGFRFQPVDAGEVAARLVEFALGRAGRPRTRHRRAACVPDGRPGSQLLAGRRQAPADHAGPYPG